MIEDKRQNSDGTIDLSKTTAPRTDTNRVPDAWTIRDVRTGSNIQTSGYPDDNVILAFKRKLGYGTVKITKDDHSQHLVEFTPVDLSASA